MRKFIDVSKYKQKELNANFPDLFKLYGIEDSPHYKSVARSTFDHWLTPEEFQNDYPLKEEHLLINKAFYIFAKIMVANTEVLNFKLKGKWDKCYPCFRKFSSQEAMLDYL